jgi:hypothetical protein
MRKSAAQSGKNKNNRAMKNEPKRDKEQVNLRQSD